MRTLALALALSLAPALVAAAADPVNATATLERATISVGDPVILSVVADAEAGYQVGDPAVARSVGELEILETLAVQRSARPGGVTRWTYRYRVTAWTIGDVEIPPISVPYLGPSGTSGIVMTAPLLLRVASVIRDGEDTSDIKPLKPQIELSAALLAKIVRVLLGIGAAAAFTAVAGLVFWLLLRRKEQAELGEQLTPVQRALRELDQLAALRLPEQGRTAEHYDRLTTSLRRYVVEGFGIDPGRTSRELRAAMEAAGVERTQATAIYEILREGDEVRFRHAVPYPTHAHNAVRAALEVVRRAATAEEYEIAALRPQ